LGGLRFRLRFDASRFERDGPGMHPQQGEAGAAKAVRQKHSKR
jgi:hypothetical protein